MRMAMFTGKDVYKNHAKAMLSGALANMKIAEISLHNAREGIGKDEWLDMNYVTGPYREREWQTHLRWLEGNVRHFRNEAMKLKGQIMAAG